MPKTREELHDYFNQILTPQNFEDYGPNGLQIEGKPSIKRVAFAVSATQDSIERAKNWGADALVVHHGVFWKYQAARPITGPWGKRLLTLIKNDINLYAYHLPLDAHPEVGNAASLAKAIGLIDIAPFGLHKKQPLGSKGQFPTPIKARDFKTLLEKLLNHPVTIATPDENREIKTLGIITGGANNEWPQALADNLDAYLTGEISEYNWHDAIEAGIHYFAGGHHATERLGPIALMERLKKDSPELEVIFIDSLNPA